MLHAPARQLLLPQNSNDKVPAIHAHCVSCSGANTQGRKPFSRIVSGVLPPGVGADGESAPMIVRCQRAGSTACLFLLRDRLRLCGSTRTVTSMPRNSILIATRSLPAPSLLVST